MYLGGWGLLAEPDGSDGSELQRRVPPSANVCWDQINTLEVILSSGHQVQPARFWLNLTSRRNLT